MLQVRVLLISITLLILITKVNHAQRVGIGANAPRATLHIQAPDSNLLVLYNSNSLNTNVVNTLWFRTGIWYTGAIKTIGLANNAARLSLYTFAAQDSNGLRERLTILDNGRVGIGTNNPRAGLEVLFDGASQVTLTNPDGLQNGRTSSLFFKTGSVYTGAIKSVGTSGAGARLSFYTFSSPDSLDLQSRMTITNEGFVGIGTTNPTLRLEVLGQGQFIANGTNLPAVTGINTGSNFPTAAGVRGNSDVLGVVGQGFTDNGVGVAGYNLGGGQGPDFLPGAGVAGYSNRGHGVFGRTTRSGGYAGVYGSAYGNETVGGLFSSGSSDGFANTLALRTMGAVRMTGIGEAAGRVLTSDGQGNATWQAPPAAAKGFSARLTSDQSVTTNTTFTTGSMTEIFDEGIIFTSGTNAFTAPETGLYQVSLNLYLSIQFITSLSRFSSVMLLDGVNSQNTELHTFYPAIGAGETFQTNHTNTRLLKMSAGDVLTISCRATFQTGNMTLKGGNSSATSTLSVHQVK